MIRGFAIAGLTMVCIFSAAAAIWARELGDNDQAQAVSAAVSGIDAAAEGGGEESDTAAGAENIESSSTAGQTETEALTETPEALADLETEIDSILSQTDGIWSIHVKNLETGESLSMNNQRMYAASLIKLFVMEASYVYMDTLESNTSGYEILADGTQIAVDDQVDELLTAMIEQSDNESYNELVRLESDADSFSEGCQIINDYLETTEYEDTRLYHTLSPSNTESESISDIKNHTSVEDCGALLEKIYNGTCVSEEASGEMLQLLLNQQSVSKIPEGVPEGIQVANKTGETDDSQHDAAIVFGEETDYILCIMSSECSDQSQAISVIQTISQTVYEYLNP